MSEREQFYQNSQGQDVPLPPEPEAAAQQESGQRQEQARRKVEALKEILRLNQTLGIQTPAALIDRYGKEAHEQALRELAVERQGELFPDSGNK